MKQTTKGQKSALTPRRRRPRGPNKRIDADLKSKLDTFDLYERYDLCHAEILKLVGLLSGRCDRD
jgi:hypothetical protein